jgi:hypothetical protein
MPGIKSMPDPGYTAAYKAIVEFEGIDYLHLAKTIK